MGRAAFVRLGRVLGVLGSVFGLAAACSEAPPPETGSPAALPELGQEDFPAFFDPQWWDADPQIGNAVDGAAFVADGGSRQAILQLFVGSSLDLKRFVDGKLAEVENRIFETAGGIARLTQTGPGTVFTQTLRRRDGELLHAGVMVLTDEVVLSYVHNLSSGAFDGTYASPLGPRVRHRAMIVPLPDGTFVFGSAYHRDDDAKANTTHIGVFDSQQRPLRLVAFVQVERTFDQSARDLENRMARLVVALAGEAGGGASIDRTELGPDEAGERKSFPALIEERFFELELSTVDSPPDAATRYEPVNIVARNAVREIASLYQNSRASFETDERGRTVEVRIAVVSGARFESRQSFEGGMQEAVAFVNRRKRLQLVRDHRTGAFSAILVAPTGDQNAPLCAIVSPNPDGTASHLVIGDLASDRHDYRAELVVDPVTGRALDFADLRPYTGGLAAQPEAAELVRAFDFAGSF